MYMVVIEIIELAVSIVYSNGVQGVDIDEQETEKRVEQSETGDVDFV